MNKIQILGTGCAKCRKLAESAEAAVREAHLDIEIEKITDITDIMEFGIMVTPALAIDGEVKSVGKVLSPQQVLELLQA
jgi:small redox-active disulfide protein 2